MAATTTTPVIPFDTAPAAPTPNDLADDQSLPKIDQELDFLMEQVEDEIEESGEASKEAMDRLQRFCQAMNVKVDRIGRYLSVVETRATHCKQEAARYAPRWARRQVRNRLTLKEHQAFAFFGREQAPSNPFRNPPAAFHSP